MKRCAIILFFLLCSIPLMHTLASGYTLKNIAITGMLFYSWIVIFKAK